MVRSFDPFYLNYLLNHSRIYPMIAPDDVGYLDGSDLLTENNYFFSFPEGGVFLLDTGEGFKLDAWFVKRCKTKEIIEECIRAVGSPDLIAEIPDFNRRSRYLVNSLGFKKTDIKKGAWRKSGKSHDVIIYRRDNDKHC